MGDDMVEGHEDTDINWGLESGRFATGVERVRVYFDDWPTNGEREVIDVVTIEFEDDTGAEACEALEETLKRDSETEYGCGSKRSRNGSWYRCVATPDLTRHISGECMPEYDNVKYRLMQ